MHGRCRASTTRDSRQGPAYPEASDSGQIRLSTPWCSAPEEEERQGSARGGMTRRNRSLLVHARMALCGTSDQRTKTRQQSHRIRSPMPCYLGDAKLAIWLATHRLLLRKQCGRSNFSSPARDKSSSSVAGACSAYPTCVGRTRCLPSVRVWALTCTPDRSRGGLLSAQNVKGACSVFDSEFAEYCRDVDSHGGR